MVAQTEDMYTLPVALALYSIGPEHHAVRPAPRRRHVVVVPILVVFLVFQRRFIEGIATTGIK